MSKNVVLEDRDANQIMPITTSENVFMSEGLTLESALPFRLQLREVVPVTDDTTISNLSATPFLIYSVNGLFAFGNMAQDLVGLTEAMGDASVTWSEDGYLTIKNPQAKTYIYTILMI